MIILQSVLPPLNLAYIKPPPNSTGERPSTNSRTSPGFASAAPGEVNGDTFAWRRIWWTSGMDLAASVMGHWKFAASTP
ncbi:hypothetical protein VKT23_013670 [Stygiomarasmius scandens]|uniref:Uncharacterized protein n=1 Tax=Marasmiellus scandens TaxID=2682957 RepID=A0ABR1J504_9AGAR